MVVVLMRAHTMSSSSLFWNLRLPLASASLCFIINKYCSNYNPIGHCMFGPISRNWSRATLLSIENARAIAEATTTKKGLSIISYNKSKNVWNEKTCWRILRIREEQTSRLWWQSTKMKLSYQMLLIADFLHKLFLKYYIR